MGSQSSRWRRSWRWSSRIRFLFRGLQLLVADRGRENRLQSALLTLTDHRVRGGKGRHEGGNAEHVQQDMFVSERVEAAGSRVKTATSGWTQKHSRFSTTLSRGHSPGDSGPATVAVPEVGAMSVPNVRTVVVFPAPFGPRNPKTSP